ncbi:MarR family winged helix-turn-helix transcriptional regulator [Marinomonas colpomeniae]|uniref:Winged helix DNA-binding protein n=1 Tax=Marinomonas colpomeniae TaxID=2774408 RepID=A0ABR8NZI5_9GAMM|nr:MarR family transcriptional regulator [Marinomonas colpomeniae]MBD5771471.1 winged helix DNA-binding protein [Marinomonas colpomeniae]
MDKNNPSTYFELFNEIAIIQQLSRASLEEKLPNGFLQPHFAVLNHLIRVHDGRTPLEISKAFQVPKTTMTHTLSGLEKHGLIEMLPNPKDGRSKCVWLTDKGRAFRGESIEKLEDYITDIAEHFDLQKIATTLETLKELRIYLDENR